MSPLPIRVRITGAFAAVLLVLLGAVAVLAYVTTEHALADEIDSALRFRADGLARLAPDIPTAEPDPRLQEPTEAFEQVLDRNGRVMSGTPGFPVPLLSADEFATVHAPMFFSRAVPHVAATARLLAVPLRGSPDVLVVGASTSDRVDALRSLLFELLVGGVLATALACGAGWIVAGWALRPIEHMRAQASAITASGTDRRLDLPATQDELHRLARTLNDMLDRLGDALSTERSFFERAGHELRTPLAAVRTEIDLALRRDRSVAELTDALHSVSQEADRLSRLADDLLVLARAEGGRLPLRREEVSLRELLTSAAALFTARAADTGVVVEVHARAVTIDVDPIRVHQALTNLLDNALRHTPSGGTVRLIGACTDGTLRIEVTDTGPGFTESIQDTSGLGLRVVRAVIAQHGGTVRITNSTPRGAAVELTIPTQAR